MKITSLGYLRVESPDAKEWASFGPEVLGLGISEDVSGQQNTVALTNDDRPGRLQIVEGPTNRVSCIGWEVPAIGDLAEAVTLLEQAGIAVEVGTPEDARAAQVRKLVRFRDPAGFTHEVFYGQRVAPGSFRPGRGTAAFVTRGQGLGHVVLVVPDLEESLDFYCNVLGFRISDEIDLGPDRLVFLHVNRRHHSLALMGVPGMRGLHHLMLQVDDLDDVGRAYDLCLDREIPIAMGLGRHTNDRMFSFYVRTPGGFDIEYGWGADLVEDTGEWVVTHMTAPSVWGHRPGNAPGPACMEPVEPPGL